jgi:hypothetical protein
LVHDTGRYFVNVDAKVFVSRCGEWCAQVEIRDVDCHPGVVSGNDGVDEELDGVEAGCSCGDVVRDGE